MNKKHQATRPELLERIRRLIQEFADSEEDFDARIRQFERGIRSVQYDARGLEERILKSIEEEIDNARKAIVHIKAEEKAVVTAHIPYIKAICFVLMQEPGRIETIAQLKSVTAKLLAAIDIETKLTPKLLVDFGNKKTRIPRQEVLAKMHEIKTLQSIRAA
jgi:septal ring factor EnvC (AmiA/AmiB activator)